jgi:hypothetical protein
MKHLDESPEGVDFQQTTNSYFISTSYPNVYYKSCGFRKNAKFPKRLAERAQSTKLDYLTFFHVHKQQYQIFKKSSSVLEWAIYKHFLRPP